MFVLLCSSTEKGMSVERLVFAVSSMVAAERSSPISGRNQCSETPSYSVVPPSVLSTWKPKAARKRAPTNDIPPPSFVPQKILAINHEYGRLCQLYEKVPSTTWKVLPDLRVCLGGAHEGHMHVLKAFGGICHLQLDSQGRACRRRGRPTAYSERH